MPKWLLVISIIFISISILYTKNSTVVVQDILPPSPTFTSITNTPVVSEFASPIPNFQKRVTKRTFGQRLNAGDQKTVICGAPFTGYHTGVDFEILPGEENTVVPVYSMAPGKIIFQNWVSGYGGVIIIHGTLINQTVTILYGHLDLNTVTKKIGDDVAAGDKLADLGTACSHATDGERKHLHLSIHKGVNLDYRGYVAAVSELSSWLDPLSLMATK